MTAAKTRLLNPLALAFIGDGSFELMARRYIIERYEGLSTRRLHELKVRLVCARAQSEALEIIWPLLFDDERDVCRRGRNASSAAVPKGATACEYRRATALESLFGWLELNENHPRMQELFSAIALAMLPQEAKCAEAAAAEA